MEFQLTDTGGISDRCWKIRTKAQSKITRTNIKDDVYQFTTSFTNFVLMYAQH